MGTVLVVDDDRVTLRLTEGVLQAAGHRVLGCPRPDQASTLARQHQVDVVVLDVLMPGLSGYEVLKRLRADPATAAIPVLMLSALKEGVDRVRGLSLGAEDYLAKPFEPDELAIRVNRLVAAAPARAAQLEGRLGMVSVPELLQTLQHGCATGTLDVWSERCQGWVELVDGRAVQAHFGRIDGREAVLAMFDVGHGRFRFGPTPTGLGHGDHRGDYSIQDLMFTAAWLADELARRPPVGEADLLWIGSDQAEMPSIPQAFGALPTLEVWQAVAARPGLSLHEVEEVVASAPGFARLAVAVLVESGDLRTTAVAEPVSRQEDLAGTIRALARTAHALRPREPLAQVLVVADEGVLGELLELRAAVPAALLAAPGESLAGAWRAGRVATLPLGAQGDTVVVHLAPAAAARTHRQLDEVLAGYAGVIVWTSDEATFDQVRWLVAAVGSERGPARGVLVTADRRSAFRAARELDGAVGWRLSMTRPTSLAELLGLLASG